VTLKLTFVVASVFVLSGVDEVKVMLAGVTLIGVVTVKGTALSGN
jgi:hypothetical protein